MEINHKGARLMAAGYDYTHSELGSDGKDYITFMTEPEKLDTHGMRWGGAIDITNDYKKNEALISRFQWRHGTPQDFEVLKVYKGQTICDAEVPTVLEKLGIKIN